MAGAVSIGEAILSDNVAGQATATGTGATGAFGVARESKPNDVADDLGVTELISLSIEEL
jgi:hypothetical protein